MTSIPAVLLIALGGCGGGSGNSSSSAETPALNHHQLVAKANAVCLQANTEIEALTAPLGLASFSEYVASLEPVSANLQSKLEELQPSAQDSKVYGEFLSNLDEAVGKLPALRAAAEAEDEKAVQKISNELNSSPLNTTANNLGLTECARNAQPQG